MSDFRLSSVVIIYCIVFLPWAIMSVWWYASLVYYLFIHREEKDQTEDFLIKVLTIGQAQKLLNCTAEYCKKEPVIVSRKPVSVDKSRVEVMPNNFLCSAAYKGQQLEWSRRVHPARYTLFLDEDSLCDFDSIPAGDVVQFQEVPKSDHLLIAAMEAYRLGLGIEQALFEKTGPLYLWGGGVAINHRVENETTWDRPSITEDTAFIFASRKPYRFKFSKRRVYSQAPLTIKDLIRQRWRWASGTYHDIQYLKSGPRKAFVYFRTVQWGLWPIYLILPPLLGMPLWWTLPLTFQALAWSFVGARVLKEPWYRTVAITLLTPIASVIHSIGSTLALVRPMKTFVTTPKVRVYKGQEEAA